MRMTKAVVPLLSSDVSILEDMLSDGEEFQVMPRPADMSLAGDGGVSVEVLSDLGPFAEFIALESKHKKLHRIWTMDWWDKEISKLMQLLGEKKEEACRINQQHVNDPVARMNKQAGVKFYWR